MSNDKNKIPKFRKSHLLRMSAKILVQQSKKLLTSNSNKKLNLLIEQAETLVKHVGLLKGAAMKAVQSLSIEGQDFIPPEVIQVLEKLQSQAPPIRSDILINVIKNELGPEKLSLISNFNDKPIASASIGQVYEAQYNNEQIVLKVQYPDIANSIESDINLLKKILESFIIVSQKKIDLNELMEEAKNVLILETNYKNEEQSLIKYKNLFKNSNYIIPNVFTDFTTSKLIVMSKEEGLEFTAWIKSNPSHQQRQLIAKEFLNLYIKEFFENQLVQTDPNPANFLINNKNQIVLLDFGATLEFDKEFVKNYQILIRKVFLKDRDKILEQVYKLNFLDKRENEETQNIFLNFLNLSLSPFEIENQPFDFTNSDYSHKVRAEAIRFSRTLKFTAPPKKLIFLHRKLGGIFMLLKRLNITADLSYFRELINNRDFY